MENKAMKCPICEKRVLNFYRHVIRKHGVYVDDMGARAIKAAEAGKQLRKTMMRLSRGQ
jgi:hypothetical protein